MLSVDVLETGRQGDKEQETSSVIVRVRSSDDNSGAITLQLSHSADFAEYSSFDIIHSLQDFAWSLQNSGEVYARVVDRAGNVSDIASSTSSPATAELLSVSISGEAMGEMDAPYNFIATTTITPAGNQWSNFITYTWSVDGAVEKTSVVTDLQSALLNISWADTGAKTVVVSAESGAKIVSNTHNIIINQKRYMIYLPLVLK